MKIIKFILIVLMIIATVIAIKTGIEICNGQVPLFFGFVKLIVYSFGTYVIFELHQNAPMVVGHLLGHKNKITR